MYTVYGREGGMELCWRPYTAEHSCSLYWTRGEGPRKNKQLPQSPFKGTFKRCGTPSFLTSSQVLSLLRSDKVDYGIGLSYRLGTMNWASGLDLWKFSNFVCC